MLLSFPPPFHQLLLPSHLQLHLTSASKTSLALQLFKEFHSKMIIRNLLLDKVILNNCMLNIKKPRTEPSMNKAIYFISLSRFLGVVQRILELKDDFQCITIQHVGRELNEDTDRLSKQACGMQAGSLMAVRWRDGKENSLTGQLYVGTTGLSFCCILAYLIL